MLSKTRLLYGTLAATALGVAGLVVAPAMAAPKTAVATVQGPAAATIKWGRLDAAVASAGKTGKPVLVTVYADWCGYCRLMDRNTFADVGVVKLVESGWIPAKLNGESGATLKLGKVTLTESEWAQGNGVQGFPATFVLDSKGKPFAGLPGYIEAPQMAQFLQDAQAYLKAGGSAKLGEFYEWVEKKQ